MRRVLLAAALTAATVLPAAAPVSAKTLHGACSGYSNTEDCAEDAYAQGFADAKEKVKSARDDIENDDAKSQCDDAMSSLSID